MTKRTYSVIALILVAFAVEPLFTQFDNAMINPWLEKNFSWPIDKQWYVKWLTDRVSNLLLALAIFILSRMKRWLEVVAAVLVVYRCYDVMIYLYNCARLQSYVLPYAFSGLLTGFVYWLKYLVKLPKLRKEERKVMERARRDVEVLGQPKEPKEKDGYYYDFSPFPETELQPVNLSI